MSFRDDDDDDDDDENLICSDMAANTG